MLHKFIQKETKEAGNPFVSWDSVNREVNTQYAYATPLPIVCNVLSMCNATTLVIYCCNDVTMPQGML